MEIKMKKLNIFNNAKRQYFCLHSNEFKNQLSSKFKIYIILYFIQNPYFK